MILGPGVEKGSSEEVVARVDHLEHAGNYLLGANRERAGSYPHYLGCALGLALVAGAIYPLVRRP